MKTNKLIVLVFTLFIVIVSCGKEVYCDCIGENPDIYIRIINEKDSTDLLFGETNIYSSKEISAYTLDSNSSIDLDVRTLNYGGGVSDSILVLENPDFTFSSVILDYGNLDVDTLTISFETLESECCGVIRRVNSVLHNGIESYDGSISTLKK